MRRINYYQILGISISSSKEEIKEAYKLLVKHFHPDLNHNDSSTIRDINEAYSILSNDAKRNRYDETLSSASDMQITPSYEWYAHINSKMKEYARFSVSEATSLRKDILAYKKYLDLVGCRETVQNDVQDTPYTLTLKNKSYRAF